MFFDALPDEAKLHILQSLSAKELVAFNRVNKNANNLSRDESLWLALLQQDFHFTEATACSTKDALYKTYA